MTIWVAEKQTSNIEEDTVMVGYVMRRIAAVGALMGCVLSLILGTAGGVSAAPAAQSLIPLGVIHVMAVDNSGQGYAWADYCRRLCGNGGMAPGRVAGLAAPAEVQTPPASSFLLRMEAGRWYILADSNTAPTLLVPGLDVWRMVVSADGQEGWAAGKVTSAGKADVPVLFQLHQGSWGSASALLAPDYIPIDLAYSADGSAGWLTARNAAGQYKLWRLSAGQWVEAPQPAGATLTYVGVGPGGQTAWAVDSTGTTIQTYHLIAGNWVAQGAAALPGAYHPMRLTVDDSGNGWLVAQAQSAESGASKLVRLSAQGALTLAPLETAAGAPNGKTVVINELSVDAQGLGWAVGDIELEPGQPQPFFLRINGDSLTAVTSSRFALPAGFALPATVVSVSPNGSSAWIGDADGHMTALSESTTPGMPRTGGGNDGAVPGLLLGLLFALAGLLLLRTHRSPGQTSA